MKIKKLNIPFAQVPNYIIFDKNISWRAKGIFAYIQAKPDDYDFSSKRMAEDTNDGVDSTLAGIKELEEYHYLSRDRQPDGRMNYVLLLPDITTHESQNGKKPEREKPIKGNSLSGETPHGEISAYKKERHIQRKTYTKKDHGDPLNEESQELNKSIGELIDSLRLVNEDYKKFYNNTTQRKYAKELIESKTLKKCINRIYLAKFCYSDKFFPHFIDLKELDKKWPKIQKFYETKKLEKRFTNEFELFIEKMEKERKPSEKSMEVMIAGQKLTINAS